MTPLTRNPLCLLALTLALSTLTLPAMAQDTFLLDFDDLLGETNFSFQGSNWSGGEVVTFGIAALYASVPAAFLSDTGSGEVNFNDPIDSVTFFYVHGSSASIPAGTASAFDAGDNLLGTVQSNVATVLNDPLNFETFDFSSPIARISFSDGVIDDFSFTLETIPVELQSVAVE